MLVDEIKALIIFHYFRLHGIGINYTAYLDQNNE